VSLSNSYEEWCQFATQNGGNSCAVDRGQRCGPLDASLKLIFAVRSSSMMDVAVLAIGFVFFAGSIAYVYACDRL
jgi:hypothetical protein